MHAPEEVVRQFKAAGRFEACDGQALRAHAAGEHTDRAIFPRSVDALQHHDNRPLRLGKESVGQSVDLFAVPLCFPFGIGAIERLVKASIKIGQTNLATRREGNWLIHRQRPRSKALILVESRSVK